MYLLALFHVLLKRFRFKNSARIRQKVGHHVIMTWCKSMSYNLGTKLSIFQTKFWHLFWQSRLRRWIFKPLFSFKLKKTLSEMRRLAEQKDESDQKCSSLSKQCIELLDEKSLLVSEIETLKKRIQHNESARNDSE